jgi:hypothetical protein
VRPAANAKEQTTMTDDEKKRIITGRRSGKSADMAMAMIEASFRGDLPGFLDERSIDEAVPPPTKKRR